MKPLFAIIVFYLVLGMFMETLAMMIATVPIITPVVLALGFDPVWFGILVMLLIETAMITPPVGSNLFVIQGVRGRGHVHEVMFGAAPFVVALLVMIGLIVLWPEIALWVPNNFFTSMSSRPIVGLEPVENQPLIRASEPNPRRS